MKEASTGRTADFQRPCRTTWYTTVNEATPYNCPSSVEAAFVLRESPGHGVGTVFAATSEQVLGKSAVVVSAGTQNGDEQRGEGSTTVAYTFVESRRGSASTKMTSAKVAIHSQAAVGTYASSVTEQARDLSAL